MTDYFVGIGGNDGNDGLTWANRFLTLNAAEDEPVVAGDTVYVGPGAYRENLTVDVSGNATGGPITYIGDVTGENTDDIGGIVRITGSDNDQTSARSNAITATARTHRTFRGFACDMSSQRLVFLSGACTDWIFEDMTVGPGVVDGIEANGAGQADITIRRSYFYGLGVSIFFTHSSDITGAGHLIENCLFVGDDNAVKMENVAGITIKNIIAVGQLSAAVWVSAPVTGDDVDVNNSILIACRWGLFASATSDITEDYNSFYNNETDRSTVGVGGNSNTFPPLWTTPILKDGFINPWLPFMPGEWSQVARIAGTGESTDDLFGIVRPTVSAKKSWGAIQLREAERETGTVQTGSAALTLADAGDHQIYVPVTATSTTFEVAARYESEYAGTLPRLIVRQPGQADQVDTMVAAADTWETLSLTFTPNAIPPYVVVIFRSLNTSVTGDFDTYWDDLDVS